LFDKAIETFAPGFRPLGTDHPPGDKPAITRRLALEGFPGDGITAELGASTSLGFADFVRIIRVGIE
jgi:hypothetical protein